mmetsp:Transcript_39752/g.85024  ORF Transcript_39752/g.85024 Transcript_39752/m.85024 type:complete len:189 (+) Transcript_39752:1254-1820(+)
MVRSRQLTPSPAASLLHDFAACAGHFDLDTTGNVWTIVIVRVTTLLAGMLAEGALLSAASRAGAARAAVAGGSATVTARERRLAGLPARHGADVARVPHISVPSQAGARHQLAAEGVLPVMASREALVSAGKLGVAGPIAGRGRDPAAYRWRYLGVSASAAQGNVRNDTTGRAETEVAEVLAEVVAAA